MVFENDRKIATTNKIAGMKILAEALSPTIPPTNSDSPRASPIPFKDHAKIRIVLGISLILLIGVLMGMRMFLERKQVKKHAG